MCLIKLYVCTRAHELWGGRCYGVEIGVARGAISRLSLRSGAGGSSDSLALSCDELANTCVDLRILFELYPFNVR